jgi:FkbM family methyltransferase
MGKSTSRRGDVVLRALKDRIRRSIWKSMLQEYKRLDDALAAQSNQLSDVLAAQQRLDQASLTLSEQLQRIGEALVACSGQIASLSDLLRRHHETTPLLELPGVLSVISLEGMDFAVPATDTGVLSYIRHHGLTKLERGTRAVIAARVLPGAIAVDIGASFGLHAAQIARRAGASGRVICFEPAPAMIEALRRTARLNALDARIEIVGKAVADCARSIDFYISDHSPMSSFFAPERGHDQRISVEAVSLDAFFHPGSRIDLIKIDAEGAEPLVWAGMSRVIRENPKVQIVMEWSSSHFLRSGYSSTDLAALVRAEGFSIGIIDEETGAVVTATDDSLRTCEGVNVLLQRQQPRASSG